MPKNTEAGDKRAGEHNRGEDQRPTRFRWPDASAGDGGTWFALASFLELLRHGRVAQLLSVEINNVEADTVLHFALTQIVQARRPLPVLPEIVRHPLRKKNVTGIAAIHHPLRQVDPRAGDVAAPAHIGHFTHRPAVHPHPHRNLRVRLERLRDLERALRRFLRTVPKDQRHSISGR